MPTITIQVGQCGNQLGQALVGHLAHQASQPSAAQEAGVFFRSDARGAQRARCVLVDTEPKVIASARSGSVGRLYDPARCYVGQSGRGNNWAFGYTDMVAGPKTTRRNPSGQFVTGGGGGVDDGGGDGPDLLHAVLEGIRREVEECDSAPDFLLVHSLAGGSGSGLGCRLLEALRESYDLNYIASVSVAPRHDGDAPMQSLNAVMTLSFLQAYADAVCLWSNTEVLERLEGGVRARSTTTDFGDINRHISQHMLGALWPLHPQEAFGGVSRIRDIVMSAAPDWTCKFVEPRTCFMPPPGAAGSGLSHSPWSDSLRALNGAYCKFDALDGNAPVVSTSSLLLARGFPPDQLPPGPSPAAASYVQLTQSHAHRPAMLLSAAQPPGGRNAAMAAAAGRGGRGGPAAGTWGPGGPASAHSLGGIGGEPAAALSNVAVRVGMAPLASSSVVAASETSTSRSVAHTVGPRGGPSVTSVCNRTSVVGLFSSLTQRAVRTVKAGAFMHWYERYGVTREAVLYAAQQVADVADCYRAAAAL